MAVQSELDDLLMVLGDLEEKASKYKVMTTWNLYSRHLVLLILPPHIGAIANLTQKRLKALGEVVSDGEDGNENDGDDVSNDDVNWVVAQTDRELVFCAIYIQKRTP